MTIHVGAAPYTRVVDQQYQYETGMGSRGRNAQIASPADCCRPLPRDAERSAHRLEDVPGGADAGFVNDEAVFGEADGQTVVGVGRTVGAAVAAVAEGGETGSVEGVGAAETVAEGKAHGKPATGIDAVVLKGGGFADAVGREEADAVDTVADHGGVDLRQGTGGGAKTVGGETGSADLWAVHLGIADGARRGDVRDGARRLVAECLVLFQGGDAAEFGRGDAEVETVEVERLRDLFLDDAGEGAAVGTLGDATEDPTVGQGVIARDLAGGPEGGQGGDPVAHRGPVDHVVEGGARRHLRDARDVAESVADEDALFAVLAEFRPVLGDRIVVADLALLGQDVQGGRGDPFADGVDREERIRRDRRAQGRVGDTGPGIDDEFAVVVDGDLESDLLARCDEIVEHRLNGCLWVRHRFPLSCQLPVASCQLPALKTTNALLATGNWQLATR